MNVDKKNKDHKQSKEKHRSQKKSKNDSKRRKKSSSPLDCEPSTSKLSDETFSWEEHRHTLNKIFFRDSDLIKKGSQEYQDFWTFLKKYETLRQMHDITDDNTVKSRNKLGLPESYHRKHKLPFTIYPETPKELMMRGCLFQDESESQQLKENQITEFASVINLYTDFLQRQKFVKLRKLRAAQSQLPIANFFEKIVRTVKDNQVVLVAGDTGCGKSTQVPQYLLAAGFGKIACTQPRRIACISLCKRVSFETLHEYGDQVAYQIRFEKTKTQRTRIVFLTEGLLLRQITTDSTLSGYDVVILDEVHERHLSCDFLLGVIKCLVKQRSDLKVVLMSATINIELFSRYFDECPVIQVPGRLYPIQIQYQPIPSLEKSSRLNPGPFVRILQQIDNKYPSNERGDLLIFLSGITEITAVVEAAQLYAEKTKRWIILPLHSTLSIAEQDKVFDYSPEGIRKCIVSTNIAETSVTIDGVRFVADSGKVKEMSYDPATRMQRLKEFWISRASAEQRKGRAGRTGPGFCFRLFSEQEYTELSAYSTPEIQRVPLDATLLQMIAMGLPDARLFPFIEPPPTEAIEESLQGLKEQGALTETEGLTPMGKMLSKLPVDVTFGKMLILGSVFEQLDSTLSLAAALSVQSPLTNRSYRDTDAMAARKSLQSGHGDPFTLLNAYHAWVTLKSERGSETKKWCRKRGFEEQRFYEITKLQRQFKDLLQESGLIEGKGQSGPSNSHERRQRHGELRKLRGIKSDLRKAPRKRKYLKMDLEVTLEDSDNQDEDKEVDVHDVEFRITNNSKQVQEMSWNSHAGSFRTLHLLKSILCSGLFPQVAIMDEHNIHKSDAEQLYHTKGKPFVAMHPMSAFALQPDLIKLRDMDCQMVPGFVSRLPVSAKHQLICYVTLLETTKPYLTNCMRVPAAHTLLLFSRQLETNADVSRIICDHWLELRFPEVLKCQQILAQAIVIRDLWQKLLEDTLGEMNQDKAMEATPEMRKMRRKLMEFIQEFYATEILHTVRRLLPANLKDAYVGPNQIFDVISDCLGLDLSDGGQYEAHPVKGGLLVRDYLNYNCLIEMEVKDSNAPANQKEWICPGCCETLLANVLEQVRHREICPLLIKDPPESQVEAASVSKHLKPFYCPDCEKDMILTSIDFLRHRQSHATKIEITK